MPQVLALEWDGSEARVVVAGSHGDRPEIEQAFAVEFRRPPPAEGEGESRLDVGEQIAAALAARGIGRLATLVAVARANIELRQLSLPPAPDDELPELVQFQAMREFNEFDEDWLLDFVPLNDAQENEPREVLAAAIGPELVRQIRGTCERAGLTPQRMILRPCAAASLLGRNRTAESSPPRLLIDLLCDEADLTVVIDRKVVFLRTTRLSGDPLANVDQRRALFAEIRRTIAAVENQLGGQRIRAIALCGSGEQHAALADAIEKELGTSTELFEPFAGLRLGRELRSKLPENAGRFAPLLGMALAELEQTAHAIDFLHPRRRPAPPSRRPKLIAACAAGVLLVGSFFGYRGWERSQLDGQITGLNKKSKQLTEQVEETKKAVAAVDEIEKWTATDVEWLDQLHDLSRDFPPAKLAMLTELKLGLGQTGGKMTLDGLVAGAGELTDLEDGLRNQQRRVDDAGSGEDQSSKPYSRRFTVFVHVGPEEQ